MLKGLLDARKAALVEQGVDSKKIESMNAESLGIFEEGLKAGGGVTKKESTDTTPKPDMGGGSGTPPPSTTLGHLKQIFESGSVIKTPVK